MKTIKSLFLLCVALLSLHAQAEVSMNSVRITAEDPLAAGEFYKKVFGMQEVNRLNLQGGAIELFLNFGGSVDAAKANSDAQLVIMQREAEAVQDGVAHLILDVTDMKALIEPIKAGGGKIVREPFVFGDSGITIGIITDPAGNAVEMLQQP
jgi:lactoylglutathione lyase